MQLDFNDFFFSFFQFLKIDFEFVRQFNVNDYGIAMEGTQLIIPDYGHTPKLLPTQTHSRIHQWRSID